MLPWLGPILKNWKDLMKNVEENKKDIKSVIANLKESLNPEMCRCYVDAFLTRKLHLEVRCQHSSEFTQRLITQTNQSLCATHIVYMLGIWNWGFTLSWWQPGVQCDESVCCRNWHHSKYTSVVSAFHGQVPSFSRCNLHALLQLALLVWNLGSTE